MRRIYVSLAAIALLVASCAKEYLAPVNNNQDPSLKSMSFNVTNEPTKTVLGNDGSSVNWKSTDKISVFDDVTDGNYLFTTSDSGSEVSFDGNVAESAGEFFGLYPYDPDASWDYSAKTIITSLSHKQTCAPGTFPDATVISAGKANGSTISFNNICSLVKFEITGSDIKEVIIKANDTEKIAGKVKIMFGEDGVATYQSLEMGEQWSKIQVKPVSGTTFTPGVYYAVVLPGALRQGITINAIKSDNKIYSKFNKSPLNARIGHIVNVGTIENNLVFDRNVTDAAAMTVNRTADRTLLHTATQTGLIKSSTGASVTEAVGYVNSRAKGITTLDKESYPDASKANPAPDDAFYKSASDQGFVLSSVFVSGCVGSSTTRKTYYPPAINLMADWAEACENVNYTVSADNPASIALLARAFFPFFYMYELLGGNVSFGTEAQYASMQKWFRNMADAMKRSLTLWNENDYFEKQYYNSNIAALNWGILSIGVALKDQDLVYFATESIDNPRNFYDLLQGCIMVPGDYVCRRESADATVTTSGELYDRYHHRTGPNKGLQTTSLTLQILSTMARTLTNNGINVYAYTCPTGENLKDVYEFYAPFYAQKDASIGDGYYDGETSRIGAAGDMLGLFELGYNAYPTSAPILSVINAMGTKRSENKVQMHSQLGYTRFLSISVDSTN